MSNTLKLSGEMISVDIETPKFSIMYRYRPSDEWEEIDTAATRKDAHFLLNEYMLAYNEGNLKIKTNRS